MNNTERDRANGARLRLLRGDKTQAQVAADLNMTTMMLSYYERGARRPNDETKIRLARYYGTTVSAIFFVDE